MEYVRCLGTYIDTSRKCYTLYCIVAIPHDRSGEHQKKNPQIRFFPFLHIWSFFDTKVCFLIVLIVVRFQNPKQHFIIWSYQMFQHPKHHLHWHTSKQRVNYEKIRPLKNSKNTMFDRYKNIESRYIFQIWMSGLKIPNVLFNIHQ